jgi:hypothetical protein
MTDSNEHVRKALVGLSLTLKSAVLQVEGLVELFTADPASEEQPEPRPTFFGDNAQ